ncbi:MAG: HIT family protein [Candidatus Pacebacteria bacterium]|nr:HIT family protein [Candidatus Paceibacterota bacterium]
MNDCIFCKIGAGEIEVNKVYEDDYSMAFLDIKPIREGHLLVIPKRHSAYIKDMPDLEYSKMMLTVKMLQSKLSEVFSPPKVGMFVSGWDVPHAHVHVVPMFNSKDITSKPLLEKTSPQFTPEEFQVIKDKIIQAL